MYTKFIQRKWLLGSFLMVAILGLVFVAPRFIMAAVAPATLPFNDGFEANNFNLWDTHDSRWSISTNNPHGSSIYKAEAFGDTGSTDDSLQKNISTAGYQSLVLSYWFRITSLDTGDHVYVEWSGNGGLTWNRLIDYTDRTADVDWVNASFSLPDGASDNNDFRFRFRTEMSSNMDIFMLDDVSLSGIRVPSVSNSSVVLSGNLVPTQGGSSIITVNVRDHNNIPISGIDASDIVISATGGDVTLTQPVVATNANGQVSGIIQSTLAGDKKITVKVFGVELTSQPVVTFYTSQPTVATIVATPASAEANLLGSSVILNITVKDSYGNPVPSGVTVNVSGTSSTLGSVNITGSDLTNSSGQVTRQLTFNNKGDVTLRVNAYAGDLVVNGNSVIHFVDTTKPIITINPSNPATVEFRTPYTDTGATAIDNIDGNITSSIVVINPVDSNVVLNSVVDPTSKIVATYQVKYNVKDTSNNSAVEAVRTVNVVDTAAPVLNSITSNATSAGALKIGDSIIFTATPAMAEPIATVSGSYNGHVLIWSTSDEGETYTATYTVTAGDIDQIIPLQIAGVTMTDEAGNVSLPADGCDVQKTIDANAPLVPVVELPEYINIANKNSVVIKFTGEANTTGSYLITDTDSATDDLSGNFVLSSSGTLALDFDLTSQAEGTITVSANLKDASGNIGVNGTDTAIKDTVAPIAPTPVLPTWINTINQTAPAISGSGEANALISYAISDSLASTVSGTGTVGSTGVINLVGSDISGLVDGDLNISMNLTDAAGNLGLAGVSASKKETIKPTLVSIDSDGKTYKVGEYDITATFSEAVTSPKIAISFSEKVGTCADISATAMTVTVDQKIYTYHLIIDDACDAALGTITVSNATDIPGNIIEADGLHSFNVDTLAPVFSAITPTTDSFIKADFTVTYILSENLSAGTIGFSASPVQTYTLAGAQLTAGSHTITAMELASGGIVMTDGGTYSIIFNGTDLVGNNSLTVTNTGIKYDTTAPAIINITSTKANGAYKVGENIVVTVQFSELVNATYYHRDGGCGYYSWSGCWDEINTYPYLTLETGITDRNVNYTSGSGTDTLTFNYTVQAGDINPDLDYISANALNLNGQTIRDFSGNDANVVLSTPGAEGSLGANKNIVIDTIAPVISAHTDLVIEATTGAGALVEYILPTANDSINGSVVVSCLPISASQFALGDTTVTCTAADALGNTATSNFKITVKDTTAPTITAPADINMPANAWLSTVILGMPVVHDTVDLVPAVTSDAPATFPVGTTVVTWTVTDDYGNHSSATQNVTIVPAPISQLDVNAETPKTTNEISLVTVNGKDAYGHITTNQSGSIVTVNVDNGGSLSSSIITLTNGVATTNLSKLSAGIVNVNVVSGILTPDSIKVTFTAADTSGPAVTQINPLKDAVNVAISSPLFLIFNEPLKSESISSANIKLMKIVGDDAEDVQVSSTVSLSEGDVRVNINPNSSLDFSSQYYFVASGVADKTGNVMTVEIGKENSGFTTVADIADHIAPTVVTAWPSGSAVEVNVNPYVDFSETMKLSTLTEDNIRLFKVGSTVSVPAVVVVQNGGTRVEIQPVLNLDYETAYYISVSANVSDEAGNKLSADYVSAQFTTITEPTAELVVTNIANVKSWAVAGEGFTQGWKWRFDVTVPTVEEKFYMRFNDWTNGAGGTIPANGNIRYYTAQGDHGIDSPITVTGNGYPTTPIILNSDLDTSSAGKQIQVYVEVQVPEGSAGGSYSTSYQIMSKILEEMPV